MAAKYLRHQTITFGGDNTEELLDLLTQVTGPVQHKRICRWVRHRGAHEITFDGTGNVFIFDPAGKCVAEARRSRHRHPRALLVVMTVTVNVILGLATDGAGTAALLLGGTAWVLFEAWPRRIKRRRPSISQRVMSALPWLGLDADDWWL